MDGIRVFARPLQYEVTSIEPVFAMRVNFDNAILITEHPSGWSSLKKSTVLYTL